ncbi:hypothetical protein V6N12_065216 [Hibiscus sabdariffa]|uniref:Uncharacterized protein n=1 Tax=Hibiscus sabdariffa TaxID=183260 RepID=A0ABR2G867_9ROSI
MMVFFRGDECVRNDGSGSDDEESEYIASDNQDSDSDSPLEDSDNDLADGDDELCNVHVAVGRAILGFSAGTRNDNEENESETERSQDTQGSINTVRWMPQSQNTQLGSQHTQGSIKTSQHQAQTQEDPASKRLRWR